MINWVKCSERMPPIGQPVLLCQTYPKGSRFNCRADPLSRSFIRWGGLRYNGMFISYNDQYSSDGLKHVSHWAEIEGPKDED